MLNKEISEIQAHFIKHEYESALAKLLRIYREPATRRMALTNIGVALYRLNKTDDATKILERALVEFPCTPEAEVALAHCYLRNGNFKEGWKHYEARLQVRTNREYYKNPKLPLAKKSSDLIGRRLFVHSKQGLGDTIQFSRYLIPLSRVGDIISVEVDKRLVRFLSWIYPDIRFVEKGHDLPEGADFQVPLLSLPFLLGIDYPIQPWVAPHPASIKNHGWAGICWRGGTAHPYAKTRDMRLDDILSHTREFKSRVSLQWSLEPAERLKLESAGVAVVDLGTSFWQTKCILDKIDIVFTVDTAVAHLAGSLGIKTNLFLESSPDWRWGVKKMRTEWYPSIELRHSQVKLT